MSPISMRRCSGAGAERQAMPRISVSELGIISEFEFDSCSDFDGGGDGGGRAERITLYMKSPLWSKVSIQLLNDESEE